MNAHFAVDTTQTNVAHAHVPRYKCTVGQRVGSRGTLMRRFGDLTTHTRGIHRPERNLIYFLLCETASGKEREESRGFQSEKAFQSLEAKELGQTRDLPRWTPMETRMESARGTQRWPYVAILVFDSYPQPSGNLFDRITVFRSMCPVWYARRPLAVAGIARHTRRRWVLCDWHPD